MRMSRTPTAELPGGDEIPVVGLGTWNLGDETVIESVEAGIDAGYTHVDTAEGYRNEAEVGAAIEGRRDDLFITSKVLPKNLAYESVIASCEATLDRLGTDYLDLYLIHWPNPAISLRETLSAMATLHDEGKVRNVGVSNFSTYQLSCAQHVSDVPIAVNQIEFHPYLQRPDLVDYCRETDTVIEAAAPLARGELFDDETVTELAETYDKSPAQIVLKWEVERGVVALPKSSSPEHVRQNLALFDWELDDADLEKLDTIDQDFPVYDTPGRDWSRETYGISR